jgi:hypothetical protein
VKRDLGQDARFGKKEEPLLDPQPKEQGLSLIYEGQSSQTCFILFSAEVQIAPTSQITGANGA